MTLAEFRDLNPSSQNILLFHSGSTVLALNISTETCDGINVSDSLQDLDNVYIQINGTQYQVPVNSTIVKPGYYSLVINPFSVSSTSDITTCTLTYLFPSPTEVGFTNSDYNAIFGNATDTRKVENQIFDVDRRSSLAVPSNLNAILSGSAVLAEVQDSFYTTTGIIRARYDGTKTTSGDYSGVDPTLSVTAFSAAVYDINTDSKYICSQSFSERPLKELVFDSSKRELKTEVFSYPSSSINLASTIGAISGSSAAPATLTTTQTSVDCYIQKSYKVQEGSILRLSVGSDYEFVRVETVTVNTNKNLNFPRASYNYYTLTLTRGWESTAIVLDGSTDGLPNYIYIRILLADFVYEIVEGKAVAVQRKKIWVQEPGDIWSTDKEGRLFTLTESCTV